MHSWTCLRHPQGCWSSWETYHNISYQLYLNLIVYITITTSEWPPSSNCCVLLMPSSPQKHYCSLLPDLKFDSSPQERCPPESQSRSSSVKKSPKWRLEEDSLIIQLHSSGMKWEDISKSLPGCSSTSCWLRYQNHLERKSDWNEESKDRLVKLYERSVSLSPLPFNSLLLQPFAAAWGAVPEKASICICSSPSTVLERFSLLYLHS